MYPIIKTKLKIYKNTIQTNFAFNRKGRKENSQKAQKIVKFKILKSKIHLR